MKKIVDKYKEDTNVYGGIDQNVEVYKEFKLSAPEKPSGIKQGKSQLKERSFL